jgi:hypothetical protein
MDLDEAEEDDIDELMRRCMGFSKFRSTKNTKVPGNNAYGVRKEKKTEYRQYMNRQGGFNRPLSPSRLKAIYPRLLFAIISLFPFFFFFFFFLLLQSFFPS